MIGKGIPSNHNSKPRPKPTIASFSQPAIKRFIFRFGSKPTGLASQRLPSVIFSDIGRAGGEHRRAVARPQSKAFARTDIVRVQTTKNNAGELAR
jgi:hypothetical protein